MPTHLAKGTLSLVFKNQKAFTKFGIDWIKMNSNFTVAGSIQRPDPAGALSYNITFGLDCECTNVIRNFNVSYQKAFGSTSTYQLIQEFDTSDNVISAVLVADDYIITHETCSLT